MPLAQFLLVLAVGMQQPAPPKPMDPCDLGYFPLKGTATASPRLIGLADALTERHIDPKRLIQTWPVRDVKREVDWADVSALVKAGRDAQKSK